MLAQHMSRLSRFLKGAKERELNDIMQALPEEWWPKVSVLKYKCFPRPKHCKDFGGGEELL